jgi:rod shape determining protein RodA
MSVMERHLIRENSFDLTSKLFRISWIYVLLLTALAGVGYVALYSAAGGSPEPYAARHLFRFAVGLVLMLTIAMIDIRFIQKMSWLAWLGGVVLLVLVLKMGNVGKGAQRWIELGGMQWQPSELMKLVLILGLASWFHRASWERMGNPLFLIPPLIAVAIPVGLILKQPNLGTAVITAVVGGTVFLAAGLRWWKVALVAIAIVVAAPVGYNHLRDYQRARIDTFLNPESDPLGAGYNIIQSKIALGSGGIWGKGYLQGTQGHLNFLPEKQTDFIFTMLAEEFGMVGSLSLLGLYFLLFAYGYAIAFRSTSHYGRLVAMGIVTSVFLSVFINVAMVMGLIPAKGMALPMVSYGGTSMVVTMIGFGMLINVWVHRDIRMGRHGVDD